MMNENQPKWIPNEEPACMKNWMNYFYEEARRLFAQDGSHASLLFLFNKEQGLVSVNPIPPNTAQEQIDAAMIQAVHDYDLYGIIFIGEAWIYFMKEKDHTAFQLLDGEMRVSDLNDEDKKEALIVRMENREGDCLVYLNEISRNANSATLKGAKVIKDSPPKWFELQKI